MSENKNEINTKTLRKNVTARALGAGAVGAYLGGNVGQIAALYNGKSVLGGAKAGATIGAGLNMAKSIRKNVKHNRMVDEIDNTLKDKSASDIVNEILNKVAGVEYGWTAYQDPTGKKTDRLSELSQADDDDFDSYEEMRNLKEDMNYSNAMNHGYNWSEKRIAQIPYEQNHKALMDFMNGDNVKNFTNYKLMVNPYSGEVDNGTFLAGRDSAEYMANQYGDLISKMPDTLPERQKDYDLAKAEYDTAKLNADKLNAIKTDGLVGMFRPKVKVKKTLANNKLSGAETKLNNAKKVLDTPTDRDIIQKYKDSLENSLKDNNNNMYEWGWY